MPQPQNISYETPTKKPIKIEKIVPEHQNNYFNLQTVTHPHRDSIYIFGHNKPLPKWLVRDKTILLPKNETRNLPKNYRPIACLISLIKY